MEDVPKEQIYELRRRFLSKVNEGIPNLPSGFHPNDLERVKDDRFLANFIKHIHNQNLDAALWVMVNAFTWRRQFNINEMTAADLNRECMNKGIFYVRGKDKDGCPLVILHGIKYVKGQYDSEDLKKCIVYWCELLYTKERYEMATLFFDMDGAGLQNLDLELTKYFLHLMEFYYPSFVNYIVVYELPLMLSTVFKILKTMLHSKAKSRLKFVNKSSVGEFIPIEHIHTRWGGKDNYVFTFEPESVVSGQQNEKKVTFLEPSSPRQNAKAFPQSNGDMNRISITPSDYVKFENDKDGHKGSFTITNNFKEILSYKIKTTFPQKFRVRPSIGLLYPGESHTIAVVALGDSIQKIPVVREKFLVMCCPVDKMMTPRELATFWQDTSSLEIEQYKLCCVYPGMTNEAIVPSNSTTDHTNFDHISSIVDKKLQSVKSLLFLNLLITGLVFCYMLLF